MMISVVVPVHNQATRLRLTLAALGHQLGVAPATYEVIVVDDSSSDDVSHVIDTAKRRASYVLQSASCSSKGARGLVRNIGAAIAQGEAILFLDADALPGRYLLARHIEALSGPSQLCLGDIYVLPGTELLSDPADGTPFPGANPSNPFMVSIDSIERGIRDDELMVHAEKGGYPGLGRWTIQMEEVLAEGGVPFAWMGVMPHNLSILHRTFSDLSGFNEMLPHMEGWDLGIRAVRAGYAIAFARGALSFHLFHYRARELMMRGTEEAQAYISRRFQDSQIDLLMLWLYAAQGAPNLPRELNLGNWRTVRQLLSDTEWRRECHQLMRLRDRVQNAVSVVDHRLGSAINPSFSAKVRCRESFGGVID